MKPQIIIATRLVPAPSGALVVDYGGSCFWRGGVHIHAEPQQFKIIAALLVADPVPVHDDDMMEALYGDREDGGPVSDILKVQVSRARRSGLLDRLGVNITSRCHLVRVEFIATRKLERAA